MIDYKTDLKDLPKANKPEEVRIKFWSLKTATKLDKEGNKTKEVVGFNIDKLKFIELLYSLGFRRYDHAGAYVFIQVVNFRIMRQVTRTTIADVFFSYIRATYDDQIAEGVETDELINAILNRLQSLFNEDLLARLIPKEKIVFNKDSQGEKFLYFKNGFTVITSKGFNFLSYDKLQGYIWETELLNRNFSSADEQESFFEKFINRVCKSESDRIYSLKSIIGYNLHDYSQKKLKATILTDSKISNDDEPNGRTGKTLFCKALGQIICPDPENTTNTTWCELNGKDFDPRNKNKYQVAGIDTKMIVLNDVRRHFDIEILFNDITEGVTVERKNQHPFKIRPRMIITTNKTIKIEGESGRDRFVEFEFSDYFSKARSPEDEFGHWFFRDWDVKEWSRFDNFMILCIQIYLIKGLIEAKTINLNARKLIENTAAEFIEWIEQPFIQAQIKDSILNNNEIVKKDWFSDFIGIYSDFAIKLKQSTFSRWINYYCKYGDKGITVESKFSGEKKGHTLHFKSRN